MFTNPASFPLVGFFFFFYAYFHSFSLITAVYSKHASAPTLTAQKTLLVIKNRDKQVESANKVLFEH